MRRVFVLSLVLVLAVCPAAWPSPHAEGEALAVFRVPEGESVSAASVSVSGAEVAETYETLSELEGKIFVRVRSSTKTTEELIAELKQRPDVITASPNYRVRRQSITETRLPNDPSADLWNIKAIRAPEVWTHTTGSRDVYVCIIGSGMYRHPDLEANIAADLGLNVSTVSGDYDRSFTSWDVDLMGSGTHEAGTIGAVGNNGLGVVGINWNVSMFPVRVFDDDEYETISKEIRAMNYLAMLLTKYPDMKLAAVDVPIYSYFPKTPEEMKDDVYYMAYQAVDNMNRTIIATGAGYHGIEVGKPAPFDEEGYFNKGDYVYPASFTGLKNFIAVGAMASDDTAPYFTNWGDSLDIAEPGMEILSTYSPVAREEYFPGMYELLDGAVGVHVTGAAVLLKSAYPNATASQIKAALLDSANKDKNPIVYPYTYRVELAMKRVIREVDEAIADGTIPAVSRDAEIESRRLEVQERYSHYRQLDGAGRVSRTGLLDVKAAYDLLGERMRVQESSSSSSGGCSAGYPAVVVLVIISACALVLKR